MTNITKYIANNLPDRNMMPIVVTGMNNGIISIGQCNLVGEKTDIIAVNDSHKAEELVAAVISMIVRKDKTGEGLSELLNRIGDKIMEEKADVKHIPKINKNLSALQSSVFDDLPKKIYKGIEPYGIQLMVDGDGKRWQCCYYSKAMYESHPTIPAVFDLSPVQALLKMKEWLEDNRMLKKNTVT
jgi:hypothetical protein